MTCFVATKLSQQNGLSGTLGMAATNGEIAQTFSALYQLNAIYGVPINYVSIYSQSETAYNLMAGYILFSSTLVSDDSSNELGSILTSP